MFSKKHHTHVHNQGFSLIELLVTFAIVTIVTGLVVVKHSAFNNAVLLRNQAYEIALAIREAQVYAVSARGNGTNFREQYGVYLYMQNDPNSLQVFINNDGNTGNNEQYAAGTDTLLENIVLDSRFEIGDVCVVTSGGTYCASANQIGRTSMLFTRPDFDPHFWTGNTLSVNSADILTTEITIVPVNGSSASRSIEITRTGQISVK